MELLIGIAVIAVSATVATVAELRRDGYHRLPTNHEALGYLDLDR